MQNSITDVPGIKVGQAEDEQALTGVTAVICEKGATGGVDVRGGAPGTRETDLLRPGNLVQKVHAIVLAGGSAFGLAAADGVVKYLAEQKIGFDAGVAKVPIVSSAILFDLALGKPDIRPDAEMGYRACQNASTNPPVEGNFGAGTGASVGKLFGMRFATKCGIGTASMDLGDGIVIGAIVAVNALGDVVDPDNGQIIAGLRRGIPGIPAKKGKFTGTLEALRTIIGRKTIALLSPRNTVIGVVATNAKFNKEETNKLAQLGQNGLALAIQPAHTMLDGDTIFGVATNQKKASITLVGAFAPVVVAMAICQAARKARGAGGLPASMDLDSYSQVEDLI